MSEPLNDESGFTLIEILIATMLTAIILTVLTASFLIFFQNTAYTSGRDDHAAGAEALSAWLDRDLASATTFSTSTVPAGCTTSPVLFRLNWKDWAQGTHPDDYPANTGTSYAAVYSIVPDNVTAGRSMITRILCSGTPLSAQGQQPLVLMRDLIGSAGTNLTTSTGTTCGSANTAVTVTLTQYHSSTTSDAAIPYTYKGCVNARTNGPAIIS